MSTTDRLSSVEELLRSKNVDCKREDSEIVFDIEGTKSSYRFSFTWMEQIESLHMACGFMFKPPPHRFEQIDKLVTLINSNQWIGHFDFWPEEGIVLFRYALLCPGDVHLSPLQCEAMLNMAFDICEDHYPAFQYLAWSSASVKEALEAAFALKDVKGEA